MRPAATSLEGHVLDLVLVIATLAFFALSVAYAAGCDHL